MSFLDFTVPIITGYSILLNLALSGLIILIFWAIGPVGFHALKMKVLRGGFTYLRLDPGGLVSLRRIKWNGDFFEDGTEAILDNIKMLGDPQDDSQKRFNDVLGKMAILEGTNKPIIMGFSPICYASNPNLLAHLELARNDDQSGELKDFAEKLWEILKKTEGKLRKKYQRISIMQPFSAKLLGEYMNAQTARDRRQVYEKGIVSGIMRVKDPNPKLTGKILIPIGIIVLFIILIYAFQSGAFNQFLGK